MSYLVRMEEDTVKRNENKDQLNNNGKFEMFSSKTLVHHKVFWSILFFLVPFQLLETIMYKSSNYTNYEQKNTTDWSAFWSQDAEQLSSLLIYSRDQSLFPHTIALFGPTESEFRLLSPHFPPILILTTFRNKTLMFSHMLIEKGLAWYSELLRLSLSELRDLNINPRNCIGTVIALNGHRKYFCMYHAKHPESSRGAKVGPFRFNLSYLI